MTTFEKYIIRFIYTFWLLFFVYVLFSLFTCSSRPIEYDNFEKETWLNIEQLSEKYHINKSQIIEQYNELKSENKLTLQEEIQNALNKHQ